MPVAPETHRPLTWAVRCRAVEILLTNRLSLEMARPPRLNLRYSELRLAGAMAKTSPFAPPPAQEAAEAGMADAALEETEPTAVAAASAAEADTPATDEDIVAPEEALVETEGEEPQAQRET